MAKNFSKKASSFFLTFFIGIIIVSFMFTGYEGSRGTPDTIAVVGHIPIKAQEYENEFRQQTALYSNFTKGKSLTSKQIEQFRIKERAFDNLVEKKLLLKFAKDLELTVSKQQIIDEIKKQSYFLTDDQFDFVRYQAVLRNNNMNAAGYERLTKEWILGRFSRTLMTNYPLSNKYMEEIRTLKNQKIGIHAIELKKASLKKHLKVSKAEIRSFLKDPKNLEKTKQLFETKKSTPDSPKPLFKKQKFNLAKQIIQDEKTTELASLEKEIVQKLKNLLKSNRFKKIKSIQKKYALIFDQKASVNLYTGSDGKVSISEKNINVLFDTNIPNHVHLFPTPQGHLIVKTFKHKEIKEDPKDLVQKQQNEKKSLQRSLGHKLSQNMIDSLKKETPVKIYRNISL